MQGQGIVRPQQSEEMGQEPRRSPTRTGLKTDNGSGGEGGGGLLAQTHRVVTQAWMLRVPTLQPPQRLEEIEPEELTPEGGEQGYRICLRPNLPLFCLQDHLRKGVDGDIAGEKSLEHRAEQEDPAPFEGGLVAGQCDLQITA